MFRKLRYPRFTNTLAIIASNEINPEIAVARSFNMRAAVITPIEKENPLS